MRIALALLAACWTGPEQTPPAVPENHAPQQPALQLDVKLERTECLGTCPSYVVEIHGDGSVVWTGRSNVAVIGMQRGHIDRRRLEQLARSIDLAGFFALDENGHAPAKNACVASNGSMSCTFSSIVVCSDTSHAVITVRRGSEVHTVDDAHCAHEYLLVELEGLIDRAAGTDTWIGR